MKRFLIIIIVPFIFSNFLFSQKGADTLFLKNGSIAIGRVKELRDGKFEIKTGEGLLFSFSKDEVERFYLGSNPEKMTSDLKDNTGLGFGITSSILLGSGEEHFPILASQNLMITYTFNLNHTSALGTGIVILDDLYLPVILEHRYNIFKRNTSPFVYLRGGGLIPLGEEGSHEDLRGGWTMGLGAGFRWPIIYFESYIKFGYRYCQTRVDNSYYYDYLSHSEHDITYQYIYHRLEVGWGFRF